MAKPPPRPGSWDPTSRPGSGSSGAGGARPPAPSPGEAKGPPAAKGTEFFTASAVKGERPERTTGGVATPAGRSDPRPPSPKSPAVQPAAPPAPLKPADLKGASTGRGLKSSAAAPEPVAAAAPQGAGDLSPFQRFAPTAQQLGSSAEARSGESMQVMAIVGGLAFMLAASAVVVVVVVVIGWLTIGDGLPDGTVAGGDGDGHIRDTDAVKTIERTRPAPRAGGGGGGGGGEEVAPEPVPSGPTVAAGTIRINGDVMFHSVEINCRATGIRARAEFKNNEATAQGLPLSEDCTVTFQGSQPARATLRGGQIKSCTFNPTNCRVQ